MQVVEEKQAVMDHGPPAYAAHPPVQSSTPAPVSAYPMSPEVAQQTYQHTSQPSLHHVVSPPTQQQTLDYSQQQQHGVQPPPSTLLSAVSPAIPYHTYVQPQPEVQQPAMVYSKTSMEAAVAPIPVTPMAEKVDDGLIMTYAQPIPGQTMPSTEPTYASAMPLGSLGASPAPVDCPSCHQRAMTNIHHTVGDCTHLWALGACVIGHPLCLCVIPYLMNSFKDTEHNCSKCGVKLATHRKSGTTQIYAF